MNTRQGMFRLWIVVSGLWLVGDGIMWYQDSAAGTQIAALDECSEIYPPNVIPAALLAEQPWLNPILLAEQPWLKDPIVGAPASSQWETDEAKLHPHCAPNVGSVALIDFVGMHAPDRDALRQRSVDAIRASTITAVAYGVAVPAGLLTIGLILAWVIRGFRSA
jgi:hypothetical protein